MNYFKYNKITGEVLALINIAEDIAYTQIDGDISIIPAPEGMDYTKAWIDGDQISDRLPVASLTSPPPMPINETQKVFVGMPSPCWVRVRGSSNMPYEEHLVEVVGGVFNFEATIAGVYYLSLVGKYSGGPFVFEAIDPEDYKSRLINAVNDKKNVVLAGGVLWKDIRWDATATSQNAINSYVSAYSAGIALPEGFYWTSFDNTNVPMTGDDMVALGGAIINFVFRIHTRGTALKEEIAAATSMADLNAININTGWPS